MKIALLLCFSLTTTFCSKDDAPAPPAALAPLQDPLPGFLVASGFDHGIGSIINVNPTVFRQMGFSFTPLVNGKITAIVLNLPAIRSENVSIYDKATGTILKTERVEVGSPNVQTVKEIEPLTLEANKEYVIAFTSSSWYTHFRSNNTPTIYPITVGDIKITSYCEGFVYVDIMPTIFTIKNYFSGDCSFKFQK